MNILRRVIRKVRGVLFHAPYMIRCREFEDFILDYLADSLPRGQRRRFELHIRVCAECRIYLDAYKTSVALGKAVFDEPWGPLPNSVPEDLVTAVLAARRQGTEDT